MTNHLVRNKKFINRRYSIFDSFAILSNSLYIYFFLALIRIFLLSFAIVFMIIGIIDVINILPKLKDELITLVGVWHIAYFFFARIFMHINIVFPFIVMVSVIIFTIFLRQKNELIAAQSIGFSHTKIILIILTTSTMLAMCFLILLNSLFSKIIDHANVMTHSYIGKIKMRPTQIMIKANQINSDLKVIVTFDNVTIEPRLISSRGGAITTFSSNNTFKNISYVQNIRLIPIDDALSELSFEHANASSVKSSIVITKQFKRVLFEAEASSEANRSPSFLSSLNIIKRMKHEGISIEKIRTAFFQKLTTAINCITFSMVATLTLTFNFSRQNKTFFKIISIMIRSYAIHITSMLSIIYVDPNNFSIFPVIIPILIMLYYLIMPIVYNLKFKNFSK